MRIPLLFAVFVIAAPLLSGCSSNDDWRTASREPAGIAPDPAITPEAVLQIYGADAWGWRGWFGIHTWIAAKRSGENRYTVYEVLGWRARNGGSVVRIAQDAPDRYWFGEKPKLIGDLRGPGVDALIDAVDRATRSYPWQYEYRVFPGPNSNTFTAWVIDQIPALDVNLPFSAIGSGYADRAQLP